MIRPWSIAIGLAIAEMAYAQTPQFPRLSEALRQPEPQQIIQKKPAERTVQELLGFLGDEPVEFRNRVRQRLQGLTERDRERVEAGTTTSLPAGYRELLRQIEEKRLDKQVGSVSSSSGSTSLVSRGTVPRILGFAVENGGLVQSTRGTVATFRGNVLGVSRWLLGSEQFPYCAPTTAACGKASDRLRGLAFHVSFDASRQKAISTTAETPTSNMLTDTVLTGSKEQLESWGLRWEIFNRRDPRDPVFRAKWREAMVNKDLQPKKEAFAESLDKIAQFTASPEFRRLLDELIAELQKPHATGTADVAQIIEDYTEKGVDFAKQQVPEWEKLVKELTTAQADFIAQRDQLTEQALARMSFAVDYTNSRPVNQPKQSNVRFVISGSPMKNEKVLLTGNLAFTWYDSVPAGVQVKQFRDVQAAIQLDRAVGSLSESVDASFSLAGYYQYMADKALIQISPDNLAPGTSIPLPGPANVLLAEKGHIGIVQAKVTFSVKGSPVKIPVALTWANRTELIKANEVRGNVGILLDMDSLFLKKN